MGSDNDTISDDSRKKHRRSSDGDADEEKGKRRKHHRHHHRRHHRSKKHDDVESVKKDYEDMEEGEIVEEDGEKLATHLPASGAKDAYSPDSVVSLQGQTAWRDSDENQKEKLMDIDKSSLGDSVNGHDVVSILPPYQDRIPDELSFRKTSESSYPLKDTDLKLNRKRANDSDEDIRYRHEGSEHFRARSEARDKEREPSVKYSRSADRRDAKYADDISHRESIDGDVDRGHKYEREKGSSRDDRREKERKKSRNRERVKDQDKQLECDVDENIVNYTESEMTIEREQKHRRERDKVIENDKTTRRASEWVSNRDTEVLDRHRERENDQCRNKEREKDRQRKRSVDRARDRDNGRQRDISKSKGNDSEGKNKDWSTDRDREKERMRERSVDRATERKREGSHRERENGQDTSRDRYWDAGRNKYHGGSSKQDRHSEYQRYDNSHIHDQVRTKSEDTSKLVCSKNSVQGFEDMHKREEEEHEEYQEKISLQLADEEDDVNKIQEESRRRRQAILEKYKNMMVQDQTPQSADIDKGNDQERLSIQQTEPLTSSSEFAYDKTGASLDVAKSPAEKGESAANHTGTRGLGEGTPKSEIFDDMFCDDIFGDTPTGVIKTGKRDSLPVERSGLHDNWDDAEGYYSYRFGELLEGRYEITAAHGKGVFSSVVRAKDLKAGHGEPEEVAIKIIRNNDTMFKAGQSELIILKKLVGADPEDRRHCVRFLSSFMYRNHLCLVFESLHMNLREVLKKFGRNIGLKLTAVRAYAKQLLIALKHLRNCGVLHCDIKPDNMLVNESKNVLKLCDFGNAMFAGKNEITPYLVSRFYRAPEIILGLSYDHPVDIWSVGCCLYELYTGKVLFPGATNNDMIRLHLELKGPFPKKMLRKGAFTEQHFDQDLNFQSLEDDPVTKKTIKRVMVNIKPKDIGNILTGSPGEDPRMLTNFKDLLDKIFILDPDKRMTVSQALAHPFITGK